MKVLHISARADHGGGPEHIYQLLKHADPRITHYVACPDDHPYTEKFTRLTGGRHFQIPHRRFSARTLVKLATWVRREAIDVVHSHGKGAGLYSRGIKPVVRVPVIHSYHGIHRGDYRPITWQLYLTLERILAHATDRFIAVSSSEAEIAKSLEIATGSKLEVIENGVEIPSQRGKVAPQKTPPIIIAVTRFERQKNPAQLVEITSLLRQRWRGDFSLLILGDGPLLDHCRQLARTHNLADTIQFRGAVDDVRKHLRRASVFLSTSLGEGLPLAPLEAMSENLPCVLSDVRGHHEILIGKDIGYLYPLERSELAADQLMHLLSHPGEGARRGELAYDFVASNYNVRIMSDRIAYLYEQLTSKGGKPRQRSGINTPLQ